MQKKMQRMAFLAKGLAFFIKDTLLHIKKSSFLPVGSAPSFVVWFCSTQTMKPTIQQV
jgi:hypothetical protein